MWNLNIIALHLNRSMVWLWKKKKEKKNAFVCFDFKVSILSSRSTVQVFCVLLFPSSLPSVKHVCFSGGRYFNSGEMCPRVTEGFQRRVWSGGRKLVFKGSWSMHKVGGRSPDHAAVLLPLGDSRLWGSGFYVGLFLFVFPLAQISSNLLPSSSSSTSNVWVKLYIASPCCVILNQWALILLLKHCGLYRERREARDFHGRLFFFFFCVNGRRGAGRVLCLLPFSLLWKKKKH